MSITIINAKESATSKPMKKIISFMHLSLDGFVAGPNGEMDWITVDQEIFDHVGQRISESDTALYGRITYQMMENYWPTAADQPNASKHDIEHAQWYKEAHKIVVSKTLKGTDLPNTTIISDNLPDRIQQIKQSTHGPGKEILLFGSPSTTHSLMQQDLLDGYWLFINPIILGHGIPLFDGAKEKTKLNLVSTRQFTSGVVAVSYVVKK